MKALTCEMCGSTDLIKQDGVFVCQSCGTKYSVEEAKRMMVEGTVDVKGTVKIDTSSELKNLYEIARRAKDSDNSENAAKYYDQILIKDPSNWEPNFYSVYYSAMTCTIAGISSAANSVANCIPSVLQLVKENYSSDEEIEKALNEIYLRCSLIANMMYGGSKSHYDSLDYDIRYSFSSDNLHNGFASFSILLTLGATICDIFGEGMFENIRADAYKDAIDIQAQVTTDSIGSVSEKSITDVFGDAIPIIKKYYPDYEIPATKKKSVVSSSNSSSSESSGGCYVATSVYGSYDCPEVWTLRRFRDYTLAETWYGRAFVHTYYAVSPTLVKWFGNTPWFKKMWQGPLDKLVSKLRANGVESTPYSDRQW